MPRLSDSATTLTHKVEAWTHRRDFMEWMSRLLEMNTSLVILLGLVANFLVVVIFALLYWANGENCVFIAEGEFGFSSMFYLSVHSFTTIGFGSIFPTCSFAHVLVLTEQYIAYVVTAVLGAVIVVQSLKPRAKIRFAKDAMFTVSDDGQCRLMIRIANDTRYPVEHCGASARCKLRRMGAGDLPTRQIELPLMSDFNARLGRGQHWVLVHALKSSPLVETVLDSVPEVLSEEDLQEVFAQIWLIDVMLYVVDPIYGQEVRFHKRYTKNEMVSHARYADMLFTDVISKHPDGSPSEVQIRHDYSLLDEYTETTPAFRL
eukprot:TRINITY_DN12046_c0_g1_i2.p1 TRINITY_DN12046_c0_g1~~TRINITY_DN12046_c0_g1_i2.p1  ORF type:complete len:318 (-),score=25.46 TRINITY_DN12046_c0_g1_i2:230-1183(-)